MRSDVWWEREQYHNYWNMLKILRLTTDNLQNFSLFQFGKLLSKANILHINATESNQSTMSKTDLIDDSTTTEKPVAQATTQNLDGIVKFLELLGNLKVSAFLRDILF